MNKILIAGGLSMLLVFVSCTATLDEADTNGDGIVTPKEQQDAGISINIENTNNIFILDDRQALDNLTLFNNNNSDSDSSASAAAASSATAVNDNNSTDNNTSDNSSS